METTCPHCGKKYKVSETAVGKQARCGNPQCKQTFTVAAPAGAPPVPPVIPAAPAVPPPLSSAAPPPIPGAGPAAGSPLAAGPGLSPLDALLSADMGTPGAAPAGPLAPLPPLAPLAPALRRGRRSNRTLIIALAGGAGVIAAIVAVYFLVASLSGGSRAAIPAWAAPYVMDGAKGIGYLNAERLRKSEAYGLIKKLLGGPGGMGGMAGAPVSVSDLEKIDEVFFVGSHEAGSLVVVRTREDMSLEQARDLLGSTARPKPLFGPLRESPSTAAPETKTAGSLQYVSLPGAFLAKTDSKTFCVAEKEDVLKPLSERLAKKAGGKLDSQLQKILAHAAGDHYFAAVNPKETGSAPRVSRGPAAMLGSEPQWMAFGVSADSSLTVNGAVGLPSTADAEKIKKQYDTAMAEMNSKMKELDAMTAKLPRDVARKAREQAEKAMGLFRAIRLTQSGSTIRLSAKWKVKDVEGLMEGMANLMGRGPF